MRRIIKPYIVIQYVLYLQAIIFFLKPFSVDLESNFAKNISTGINIISYSVSIFLCLYLSKVSLSIIKRIPFLILTIGFCALSIMWSGLPSSSINRVLMLLFQMVQTLSVSAAIIHWRLNPLTLVRQTMSIIISANVLFYFTFPELALSKSLGEDGRYDALMPSPNNLAQIAILTIALWYPSNLRQLNWVGNFTIICGLFCLYLSGSATGLVTVVTLTAINTFVILRRHISPIIVCCSGLLIIGGLILMENDLNVFKLLNRDANLTGRTIIWTSALQELDHEKRNLLGFGIGGFWDPDGKRIHKDDFLDQFMQMHNGYLETYIQLGWLGLSLLIYLVLRTLNIAWSSIKIEPYRNISLALIAIIINNFSESSFFSPKHPNWLLLCLFYLLLSTYETRRLPDAKPSVYYR